MASNNNQLVFYQQWAVAWLQTDKYSTNPWCVDSKNLDIFSDTQSVKGTAWSNPTQIPSVEYVDVDEKWRFYLLANWNVYDSVNETTMDHSFFDTNAQYVDYKDWEWSNKAVYGTPLKLFVAYEWDTWRTITVVTDRTWHTRYNTRRQLTLTYSDKNSAVDSVDLHGDSSYATVVSTSSTNFGSVRLHWSSMTGKVKMTIDTRGSTLTWWKINITNHAIQWDEENRTFKVWGSGGSSSTIDFTEDYTFEGFADAWWGDYWQNFQIQSKLDNTVYRLDVTMYLNEKWDYMVPADRTFKEIDWLWYMFDPITNTYEEIDIVKEYDVAGNSWYNIFTAGQFPVKEWQQIAALTKTFDYRLVFVNDTDKEMWYVYLVPAGDDILTFQQWWEYPWLKFINAVMVNGYSYVIAEERGIRWLYIFYNWQTKKIVWADTKYTEAESIIDWKQIYNFTWPMLNWRGHVVAPTVNWVYMYWENKRWQNVWAFILKVDWTITSLEAKNNQLKVIYTEWANTYYRIYQDDVNIKNYLSDWSITYPVQIGTHMLEKEVRDLEISYYIPWGVDDQYNYLDVYVSVNDYYFWTFNVPAGIPDIAAGDVVALKWWANYDLVFLEKNWTEYTFYLDWGLPYQTSNAKKLIYNSVEYDYTYMNHFKKIGRCTIDNPAMLWWKHRIFKIWTDNALPIVRKMQIRVDWHTNWHNSPLLYSIRLLSDQQDR